MQLYSPMPQHRAVHIPAVPSASGGTQHSSWSGPPSAVPVFRKGNVYAGSPRLAAAAGMSASPPSYQAVAPGSGSVILATPSTGYRQVMQPGSPAVRTEPGVARAYRYTAPQTSTQVISTPQVQHRQVCVEQVSAPFQASPQVAHRPVQQAPSPQSPRVECRASPVVLHRNVAATSVSGLPAQAAASTVVPGAPQLPHRGLNPSAWLPPNLRPAPRGVMAVNKYPGAGPPWQPTMLHTRTHGTPAVPRHFDAQAAAAAQSLLAEDFAIQRTVSMLPPSPGNTLVEFLKGVGTGEVQPAMCFQEVRIDIQRYWEMRRVQNSVRRLLEALQMNLSMQAGSRGEDLANRTWDTYFNDQAVTEAVFENALAVRQIWPPEMSPADRTEVFAALRVPCSATVRALRTGQPLTTTLTKRMLQEGFTRVPFNLPDFPVPTALVHNDGRELPEHEVASHVAAAFSMEVTGLEQVKDYYLCGLLSLEQIQAALPVIVPDVLVERAVMHVIRVSTARFSSREWNTFVVAARTSHMVDAEAPPQEVDPALQTPPPPQEQVSLVWQPAQSSDCSPNGSTDAAALLSPHTASREVAPAEAGEAPALLPPAPPPPPSTRHRPVTAAAPEDRYRPYTMTVDEEAEFDGAPADAVVNELPATDSPEESLSRPRRQTAPPPQSEPSRLPMTEPVPHRNVAALEEPVKFGAAQSLQNGLPRRLINWASSHYYSDAVPGAIGPDGLAVDPGHQADEGAGLRSGTSAEQVASTFGLTGQETDRDDPVRLISLDMHNECLGPFLAQAFVRCCQLYESRGEDLQPGT